MKTADYQKFFKEICDKLRLGMLKSKAKRVSGGYMHKMYRIKTSSGDYAVKLLNPVIMQRLDVFDNYKLAEELENKLQAADISIVPALEFDGRKMQCFENQYFYVFNWINGKALTQRKIKAEHCEKIGRILAKIHKIACSKKADVKEAEKIDWDFYIEKAKQECPEIVTLLTDNRELLYKSMNNGNAALKRIPNITCVSNGDMDSKNVLWVDNEPLIIDLECLNYGNPFTELFQLSLCWCGYEHCKINYNLLKVFICSYIQEYGSFYAKWEDLYYSNLARHEWLEYNIKRALRIECNDDDECRLGIEQVKETMKHIVYYEDIKDELLPFLENIK